MDFIKLLQSLDELLFEVVSWLLFYPLTLWKVIRAPLRMMETAGLELTEAAQRQFDDTIPPPLFLALTMLLIHIVEVAILGKSYLATVNPQMGRLIGSDTNLTIFRIIMISLLPLTAAIKLARAQGKHLDRAAIKVPFYSQCYPASLFAIMLGLGFAAARLDLSFTNPGFLAVMAVAFVWLLLIEAHWFSSQLGHSFMHGLWQAAMLIGVWVVLLFVTLLLL
jgi:hypothetical protein